LAIGTLAHRNIFQMLIAMSQMHQARSA